MDWHRLRSWSTSKEKSFEELCYQVAKTHYGHLGRFTSVDDSGGGDGVEFYLTFPDGTEWGWQAKFYAPGARLNDSNRKTNIRGSLVRALNVHPRLTKWILCVPMTFTPDENAWFRGTERKRNSRGTFASLPEAIPTGRSVEIDLWSESDFGTWLTEPRFAGKRHFFFGDLELDHGWFTRLLNKQRPNVSLEYQPGLHVTTNIDKVLETYLATSSALDRLTTHFEELKELRTYTRNIISHQISEVLHDQLDLESWLSKIQCVIDDIEIIIDALNQGEFLKASRSNFKTSTSMFETISDSILSNLATKISAINFTGVPDSYIEDKKQRQLTELSSSFEIALDRVSAISTWLDWMLSPALHIYGEAGVGKTHVVFDLCHRYLESDFPAIFLSARGFRNGRSLVEQLRDRLDVPPSYSWSDLLAALDSVAQAYRRRLPIVIDGLNESGPVDYNNLWITDLHSLIAEIKNHPALLLITTCRTSYLSGIWPNSQYDSIHHFHTVEGFGFFQATEAVAAYFKHYKLNANLSLAPLQQFSHPIYLRIFCEAHNSDNQSEQEVYFGEVSLYEVFDRYLLNINRKVVERTNARPGQDILSPILQELSSQLWESKVRSIPLETFIRMTDDRNDVPWTQSKAEAILSEGLVTSRDYVQNEERVGFTYDLLGGYLIAKYLLSLHETNFASFLSNPIAQSALLGIGGPAHPLAEDIGRCLAALWIRIHGQQLHIITNDTAYKKFVLPVIFELPAKYISEHEISLISDSIKESDQIQNILVWAQSVLLVPNHPLNTKFLTDVLSSMSLTQRDLTWSEALRKDERTFQFMSQALSQGFFTEIAELHENISLLAEFIVWLQTSTNRTLRDLSTRALHQYGQQFPSDLLKLFKQFILIKDPYIIERMLAAVFGVIITFRNRPSEDSFVTNCLPAFARTTYDVFFAPGAVSATSHVLSRNYAQRIIAEAIKRHPSLLTPSEIARTHQPYPADLHQVWGRSVNRDTDRYLGGNSPLGLDFRNYTLARLVQGRRNYDFEHPGFLEIEEKVWWRIYDLGYRLEDFAEIDAEISDMSYRSRSADGRKIERYGKKYAWVAYYEIAGSLIDDEKLEHDIKIFNDIDPSFPNEPQRYEFANDDWLGRDEPSTGKWIVEGGIPDIVPLLITSEPSSLPGNWILLDGHVTQSDEAIGRERFLYVRSFFVLNNEFQNFMDHFAQQSFASRWLPEKPEFEEHYAADLPPSLVLDEWKIMTFSPKSTDSSVEESPFIWDEDNSKELQDFQKPSESLIEDLLEKIQSGELVVNPNWRASEPYEEKFEISHTVVDASWPDYKSAANPSWSVTVPSRELIDRLHLRQRPHSFEYEDSDGDLRSVFFKYNLNGNAQHFAFISSDSLDSFLLQHDKRLVWAVWGERSLSTQAHLDSGRYRDDDLDPPAFSFFQKIFTYNVGEGVDEVKESPDSVDGL